MVALEQVVPPWDKHPTTRIPNSSVTKILSVRHKKAGLQLFPAYRFRQERLNSNSRVAFDHQIVIIIIKIVFGYRNEK